MSLTIDLVLAEINGRQLFPSVLEESVFFRTVKSFVLTGIEERTKIREARERASSGAAG